MKKNNIFKLLSAISFSSIITPIISCAINNNFFNESIEEKSLSDSDSYLSSNFITDQYNSINVFSNKPGTSLEQTSSLSGPNYISGPRGVVVGNSRGYLSYIDESGNEIWESQLPISGYGKRLIGGYYNVNDSSGEPAFYCLAQNINGNGKIYMYIIKESDGTTIRESENGISPEQQWPYYFVQPLTGYEINNRYVYPSSFIFSREAKNKDNLISYYDQSYNQFFGVTLDDWNTSWKLMSAGFGDSLNTRYLCILFYDGSSIKLRFYESTYSNVRLTNFITKKTITIDGIDNFNASNVITNSPSMYIKLIRTSGSSTPSIYVSFVLDFYEQRTWLYRLGLSADSWNFDQEITSFDQNGLNIDIANAKLLGDYFYCSVSASSYYSGSQIVKINVAQKANSILGNGYELETKNYKTGADIFNGDIAYYNTNFGGNAASDIIVAAPFGNNSSTSDIVAINYSQNKIQSKNYKNNNYLYKTKFTSDEIAISDVLNVNAIKINQEELNTSKYKDQIVSKITQYQDGSSFSINKKPNNENEWSLGRIPVTVTVSKGYSGESKTAETISIDTVLTGFKIISTELNPAIQSNGMLASGSIADIYADEFIGSTSSSNSDRYNLLKTWICEKTNEIFENYPTEKISESDISLVILKGSNSTSISVQITLSRCYVDGNITTHTFPPITINGFPQRSSTTISTSNIDISRYPILSNETVDSVTEDDIKNYLWNNKETYFLNLPSDARENSLYVTIINRESSTGTVQVLVKLIDIYDGSGNHVIGEPGISKEITITGFTSENKSTTFSGVNTNVSSNSELARTVPTDITNTNDELKQFIFDNLIQNKAPSTTVSNIINISFGTASNIEGTLVVNSITLDRYQDSNGKVHTGAQVFTGDIKLTGFQVRTQTTFDNSNINVNSDHQLNTKTTDNITESEIENFIWTNKNEYFSNLPPSFALSDIDVVFGTKKPSIGEIEITIFLNKYYDSNGIEQSINHGMQFSSKVVGLVAEDKATSFSALKTSVVGTNLTNTSPTNIDSSNSDLKTFVVNNLLINKPSNFTASNITSISISEKNNLDGTLRINDITINKYLNSDGVLVNDTKIIPANIKISGFKVTGETSLDSSIDISRISSLNSLNTTEVSDNDIKDALFENKNSFFSNLPPSFASNDISVSVIDKFSSEGKIIVDVSITKYYDSNGVEKTSPAKEFTSISIFGFQKLNQKTQVITNGENNISNTSLSQIIPQNIEPTNVELKKYIADNLVINKPADFSYENIVSLRILNFNNIEGTITIDNLVLNNTFNENGGLVQSQTDFNTSFTISGFKTVEPTKQITSKFNDSSFSDVNINNVTDEQIKQIVFDNLTNIISGLPEGIGMDNLNVVVSRKQNGTIYLSCQLNAYYDSQGIYTTGSNYNFNLEIGGFLSVNYTIWWFIVVCVASAIILFIIAWLVTTSTKNKLKKIEILQPNKLAPPPKSSKHLEYSPSVKKVSRSASVNNHLNSSFKNNQQNIKVPDHNQKNIGNNKKII